MVKLSMGGREINEIPEGAIEIELHKKAYIMRLQEGAEIGSDTSQGVCRAQILSAGDWIMLTPTGGVIAVDPRGMAAQGWFPVSGFICECCSRFFRESPNPYCTDADLCDECFNDLAENDPDFSIKTCRVCGCTDDDCSQCIAATGAPCHWVEDDLCSRCADELKAKQEGAK